MIEIAYDLEKEDFLNFQLYTTSKDENIKKQQKKEKYRIAGISLLFACVLFFDEGYRTYSYFFLGSSILYFLFYPWWSRKLYKRMYKQQIEQHFKDDLPYHMQLSFSDHSILINTAKGGRHLDASNISSITEIKDYFFITENISSTTIIIPKKSLKEEKDIKDLLLSYTETVKVSYSSDIS